MPQTNTNEWEKEIYAFEFSPELVRLLKDHAEGRGGAELICKEYRRFIISLLSRHDKEHTAKEIQKTAEAIEMSKAGWIEQGRQERTAEVLKIVMKVIDAETEMDPFQRRGLERCILTALRSPEGEEEKG